MVAISIGGCSVVIELGKGGVDVDGTSLGMVVVGAVVVVFVTIESFVGSVCSCSDVTFVIFCVIVVACTLRYCVGPDLCVFQPNPGFHLIFFSMSKSVLFLVQQPLKILISVSRQVAIRSSVASE